VFDLVRWGILAKVLPWTGLFCVVKLTMHWLDWEPWAFDALTGALFSTEQAKIRSLSRQMRGNRDTDFLGAAYVLLWLFLGGSIFGFSLGEAPPTSESQDRCALTVCRNLALN
jgi:hypothetical protein